jgi:hypothetical protein
LVEDCEGKVVNLLASIDNVPELSLNTKIEILLEIIELQQKQIEDLRKLLDDHYEDYAHVEKPLGDNKE